MRLYKEYVKLRKTRSRLMYVNGIGCIIGSILSTFYVSLFLPNTSGRALAPLYIMLTALYMSVMALALCFAALIPAGILRELSDEDSDFYTDSCLNVVGVHRCKVLAYRITIILAVTRIVWLLSLIDIATMTIYWSVTI